MNDHKLEAYHPLQDQQVSVEGAEIRTLPWQEVLILRGWWKDAALKDWFKDQFGCKPPKAMMVKEGDFGRVVWHGPDSLWVFFNDGEKASDWVIKLRATLPNMLHVSFVELSNYYVSFHLSGQRAKDVLHQGCPFDFDRLEVDQSVFTVFYKASLLVDRRGEDSYVISVRQSYAPYLWQHFLRATSALAVF